MVSPVPAGTAPTRRTVLAAGLGGAVAVALAGCTGEPATSRAAALLPLSGATPSPTTAAVDAAALDRARAAAGNLLRTAQRLAGSRPAVARAAADAVRDHRAHLAALGGREEPSPSPAAVRPSPASVVAGERAAAQQALDDVAQTSPAVAALLARVAAARAVHADLIAAAAGSRAPGELRAHGATPAVATPAPSVVSAPAPAASAALPATTGTPGPAVALPGAAALAAPARQALVALTAGEHAAVFAYGVVAARVRRPDRAAAHDGWAWHRSRRDLLEERLLAAGVTPPAAAPAYDVGTPPATAAAATLAATVEDRLAALLLRAVAETDGDDRRLAAEGLVTVARRSARWTGRGQALPG